MLKKESISDKYTDDDKHFIHSAMNFMDEHPENVAGQRRQLG